MKALLFSLLSLASLASWGQDERYFRRIFSNELISEPNEVKDYKVIVKSPNYLIDINRDGIKESLKTEKRDGIDLFIIKDNFGRTLFEKTLSTIGSNSNIFKVQLKTISKNTDALIIHFYEGAIDSTRFEAQARLYFLAIQDRDLTKLHFYEGPHFFHEKEQDPDKYAVRRMSVNVVDYNNDGVKEISVSYNKLQRLYMYVANGIWKRL